MDYLKNYLILGMAALVVTMGLATLYFRTEANNAKQALALQNDLIEAQKRQAKEELDTMTAQRDEKQRAYDDAVKTAQAEKEQFDEDLEKLRSPAVPPAPVRVRLASCDAGRGGAPAASGLQGGAAGSPETQTAASGVLDAAVVGALGERFHEVELLQRDYNICRADLLGVRGIKE